MPTSSRLATRPVISMRPLVGSVMRERTFKSVDLPAPLRPIIPTLSPRFTSKETSLRAKNSSVEEKPLGGWMAGRSETAAAAGQLGGQAAKTPCNYVAERCIPLGPLVADDILLGQILDFNYGVAHIKKESCFTT